MNKKEFKKVISDYIETENVGINDHKAIKAILVGCEGKPFNHKTFNEKNLNGFTFKEQFGMYYICSGIYDHLVGYRGELIDSERFEYLDNCCGNAAIERITAIEKTDLDKAFKLFNEIDKTFNKLRELFGDLEREKLGSFNFPPYYSVLRSIYEGNYFKITDFYHIRK